VTNGDIRSCIGALQFASAKNKRFDQEVLATTLGKKDMREGIGAVWDKVFRTSTASNINRKGAATSGGRNRLGKLSKSNADLQRSMRLLDVIHANGQYDKMLEGCFEHYCKAKGIGTFDPKLEKLEKINEWTVFNDVVSQQINAHQHFTLMKYKPYIGLAFNHEFSSNEKQFIRFPKAFWETRSLKANNQATLDEMLDDAIPSIRRMLTPEVVVMDMISPFLDICSPAIRPVAPTLLSVTEKFSLQKVVGTMAAYNVTFKQVRGEHGYEYHLDPPLDQIVNFTAATEVCAFKQTKWGLQVENATKQVIKLEPFQKRTLAREQRLSYHTKQVRGGVPASGARSVIVSILWCFCAFFVCAWAVEVQEGVFSNSRRTPPLSLCLSLSLSLSLFLSLLS
jgi:chromosome transmission fidelity protein 18